MRGKGRFPMLRLVVGALVGLLVVTGSAAATTTTTTTSTTTTIASTTTSSTSTTTTTLPAPPSLQWPKTGSAAFVVPELSVAAASTNQPLVPIASLTKMMTAWVVLHRLPLGPNENGPCETVNGSDLALYEFDEATDQSTVPIVAGMQLCERVLLRGMLVHSAGDYAQLLVALAGMHEATFVAAMNQDARALGLGRTHYVDVTGINPGDVSTARDQAMLAADLMTEESVVQGIVDLTQVFVPIAGVVVSYTPFVGQGNVVGVKSGYTEAAGGCDVMAVDDYFGKAVITTYAVVLGEHGDNALGTAGTDALALSRSIRSSMARVATSSGTQIQWIGAPGDLVAPTAPPTTD